MPAYVIVDIEITDPGEYEEYKNLVAETIRNYGGKYLVRGGTAEVLEGNWVPGRLVVLEFPTATRAKEWWSGTDYARAREIRRRSADARMILVEGIEKAAG